MNGLNQSSWSRSRATLWTITIHSFNPILLHDHQEAGALLTAMNSLTDERLTTPRLKVLRKMLHCKRIV